MTPVKFNVEPHGKLTISGMTIKYEIRDDGYYYHVDFDKLVQIIECQQEIINKLNEKLKQFRNKKESKGFVPTARNSEEWR